MDEFLRNFISRKWNVRGVTFTFLDLLLAVCITGTGLALRSTVIEYTPTDTWKLCAVVLEFALAVLCGATSGNFGALISAPASVTGLFGGKDAFVKGNPAPIVTFFRRPLYKSAQASTIRA